MRQFYFTRISYYMRWREYDTIASKLPGMAQIKNIQKKKRDYDS